MALSSMTGFARSHGVSGAYAWAWEIKSVNGKGLDLRLRLPSGWDAIEAGVRARAAEALARGSVQAGLTVERSGAAPVVRINTAVLDALLASVRQLARQIEASPPSLDGLLALKGVMEVSDSEESEDERRGAEAAAAKGFAEAIGALVEMRRHEGSALLSIWFMMITGSLALIGLWKSQSTGHPPRWNVTAMLIFSLLTVGLISRTGYTAGGIRHTEIREGVQGTAENPVIVTADTGRDRAGLPALAAFAGEFATRLSSTGPAT